jgi:Mrp family chromosome partitioning ATPase
MRSSARQRFGIVVRRTTSNVVRASRLKGLDVLVAGQLIGEPPALLASSQATHRLGELMARYEVTVIDSAPVLSEPDAAVLAARVDAALLVIDSSRSGGSDVARACDMMRGAGCSGMVAVLNRTLSAAYPLHELRTDGLVANVSETRVHSPAIMPADARPRRPSFAAGPGAPSRRPQSEQMLPSAHADRP